MAKCTVCKECYITGDEEVISLEDHGKALEAMRRFSAHGFDVYQWNEDMTVTLYRE
tara:strand:+ start:2257 stop:2424 length:168 start_codon:yes stop_codon:yes gene_type:complete